MIGAHGRCQLVALLDQVKEVIYVLGLIIAQLKACRFYPKFYL